MPSTRQLRRSGSVAAGLVGLLARRCPRSSPRAANPPGTDIDSDSSDVPSWPASRGPDGETIAAVDISGYGQV